MFEDLIRGSDGEEVVIHHDAPTQTWMFIKPPGSHDKVFVDCPTGKVGSLESDVARLADAEHGAGRPVGPLVGRHRTGSSAAFQVWSAL